MRTALVGVIGHVDHGKTLLVKALTGIDTDRLKEEKERGISIALGFSHLAVPGGEIDLIDMPGHERFVRTMISGATGIEAVLLVVAANEGVKPQTLEHIDIAGLIGVKRGIVVVSKCDLVGAGQAQRVADAALECAAAAGLTELSVVSTSALTGQGIEALRDRFAGLLRDEQERADHGFCYLPIDRVFAVSGFGTVVTGTLRRGRLAVGDEVELVPGGRRVRVRSLQIHNRPVEATAPGRRTAVNLRGVEKSDLKRGDALATPGLLAGSRWLDVELRLLSSAPRPLANGQTVRLLFGTTETMARVRLLDRDQLEPGTITVAQLHCPDALAVPAHEPFILRTESPPATIGGGRILDPCVGRHRRHDDRLVASLWTLSREPPAAIVAMSLWEAGWRGCRLDDLARRLGLAPDRVRMDLAEAEAEALADGTILHRAVCRDLEGRILALIGEHHRRHPTQPGLPRDRLACGLPGEVPPAVLATVIATLAARGRLRQDQGVLRRADFDPVRHFSDGDRALIAALEKAFHTAGLTPPDVAEVVGRDQARLQALRYLIRDGVLVRTFDRVQKREIVFHRDAIARARRILRTHLADRVGGFLVGEVGQLLGMTRKFSIPLLEHLDATGFMRRVGDRRVINRTEAGQPERAASPNAPHTAAPGHARAG